MNQLYASSYVKSLNALKIQWGKCLSDLNSRTGSPDRTLALIARPGEFSKAKIPSYLNQDDFNEVLLSKLQGSEL